MARHGRSSSATECGQVVLMPGPLLVVAAWEPELAALVADAKSKGPRRFRSGVVGVGLVEAAAGAARLMAALRPRAVILIGTAGVYAAARAAHAVGDAVVAMRMHLMSAEVVRGAAYFPAPCPVTVEGDRALGRAIAQAAHLATLDVACPLGITRKSAVAVRIAETSGAALENLESFAVARASALAQIPFAAVLGIANVVGPGAHVEWKRHGAGAAATACSAVRAWLDDARIVTKAPTRSPSRR
jgi:nucleoside phosphorylase